MRAKATAFVLKWVKEIVNDPANLERIERELTSLSNAEFAQLMEDWANGTDYVQLILANSSEKKLTVKNNLRVGRALGHKFFERVWLTDATTGVAVLSNKPAMLLHLPNRRQAQMLEYKISIADDNSHLDELTGQPTGDSKSTNISFPQYLILRSRGLDKSAEEFFKVRGGDGAAFNASNRAIIERGSVTLEQLRQLGTRAKSTDVLSALYKSQHLDNNA